MIRKRPPRLLSAKVDSEEGIRCSCPYIRWHPLGGNEVVLDDEFSLDELKWIIETVEYLSG